MRKLKKITYGDIVKSFLLDCKLRNLSQGTIDWYEIILRKFPSMPTRMDVEGHILREKGNLSPTTINGHIRALNVFCNFCVKEGHIEDNPIKNIGKLKEKGKVITHFSEDEIRKLLNAPNKKTFAGLRDYTIMALLLDTGMRISELIGIKKKDIHVNHLFITGKGNKERIVPIGDEASRTLQQYLSQISDIEEYIFVTVNNERIKRNTTLQRVKYYGEKIGIEGVRLHAFRHTFAIHYLKRGGDSQYLQSILGHTSSDMTRRYLNDVRQDTIEAHQRYSPLDAIKKRRR